MNKHDVFGGLEYIRNNTSECNYLVMGTHLGYQWPPPGVSFMINGETVTMATPLGRGTQTKKQFLNNWEMFKNNIFLPGTDLKDKVKYKITDSAV